MYQLMIWCCSTCGGWTISTLTWQSCQQLIPRQSGVWNGQSLTSRFVRPVLRVLRRQPHRRSGLVTLPSVRAIP